MKRRSTKQRDIVSSALSALYHPTADEVFEAVSREYPGLGRSTVFRNLSVLEEEGLVVRLSFPGEAARYDPTTDGHAHFICDECGQIIDLPVPNLQALPRHTDCIIRSCAVLYRGFCRQCHDTQNKTT